MEIDDNDNEVRITSKCCMLTMHARRTTRTTRSALKAPDAEQFKVVAIIKEITDLIETTNTLTPLSTNQVKALGKMDWVIGTTLKCKHKKKGNGQPDKHKARGAARGDQRAAKILKAGQSNSEATFAFMIQVAIGLGLISERSATSGRDTDTNQVGAIRV